ncbi:N-acetyltransferase ESCO1 [Melipona quadrifasciata]|uniref:N-acetyltransferase ESCO1 n=1 Tax=Melipona quadrifasciata TaxID=166423 RepID=A0A0N1IU54_9HYME|nr:N-acetyltransferase ESCO1 [Melipona quadrifasciata]
MSNTPERQFGKELQNSIVETPHKSRSPENKLITPLNSENKIMFLPRLQRRKSLNILDAIENSPEKKKTNLKRHAFEELESRVTKSLKTDENHLVSKARAALFQDKDYESKLKNITLSTKNFYSNSETRKNYNIISGFIEQKQKAHFIRHAPYHKRHIKAHIIGGINAGVSHNIRKPKLKTNVNSTKHNNSTEIINNIKDMNIQKDLSKNIEGQKTDSRRNSAIFTINNNVKLKIDSNGKMVLNQKNNREVCKRPKTIDISFDATDLSVDESNLETTVDKERVANILKILENDWADDDYDTMEILTDERHEHISPLKPVAILNDVTMSPATELSNMTSTMNIKDISSPTIHKNISLDNNEITSEEKYYPLFEKGYFANKIFSAINKKSVPNMKETTNWQLSMKLNGSDNQYQLDAGQKNFGATQCTECGIVYQIGDPEDENAHLNYHNNKKSLKFLGWKTEHIVMEDPFTSSRVILVEPGDPKLYWKKVKEVLEYVDRDLGLVDTKLSNYEEKKVYLYIRNKAIIGVLVAEHITTAHRMIPELLELDCCTAENSPAKCGINVVWTDLNHRRQGIATKLIDILRAQFYFGYIMSIDDIAFSVPTPSGKIFAEKYTKTRNFKVYN